MFLSPVLELEEEERWRQEFQGECFSLVEACLTTLGVLVDKDPWTWIVPGTLPDSTTQILYPLELVGSHVDISLELRTVL